MTADDKEGWWLWQMLRPRGWLPYLGLPLLGWSGSPGSNGPWFSLLWSGLYLAGGYGFNGVCDRKTDDVNKNPLRNASVSSRVAGAISLILLAAPIPIAIVELPAVKWLSLAMVVLGVGYSLPRWGLKRMPGVASLVNVALFVPLYWIGANRMPVCDATDLLIFTLLSLPSLQSQLMHELSDSKEDRSAGIRNTATWLGESGTGTCVQVFGLLVVIVSALAWQRGVLGPSAGLLFGTAGIVSAVAPRVDSEVWLNWRRRIKLVYLVPCGVWLLEGLAGSV